MIETDAKNFSDAAIHPAASKAASIPRHICIAMDGNRRWAKLNKKPVRYGHLQGAEAAIEIVRSARDLGIHTITLYAFSTENWKRSPKEIRSLMSIFRLYLYRMKKDMLQLGIRFHTIGDLSPFTSSFQKAVEEVKIKTADCKAMNLVLALNYGGRDEIRRAALRMAQDYREGKIEKENFTEDFFRSYLDTSNLEDPDLFIRTSGEQRISNFLLWQISYSELYITDTLWPDFTKRHLIQAIDHYQYRERRLGS
ncbi:MAG: isoprenyl transferase [Simkaniaceae bacterium]